MKFIFFWLLNTKPILLNSSFLSLCECNCLIRSTSRPNRAPHISSGQASVQGTRKNCGTIISPWSSRYFNRQRLSNWNLVSFPVGPGGTERSRFSGLGLTTVLFETLFVVPVILLNSVQVVLNVSSVLRGTLVVSLEKDVFRFLVGWELTSERLLNPDESLTLSLFSKKPFLKSSCNRISSDWDNALPRNKKYHGNRNNELNDSL